MAVEYVSQGGSSCTGRDVSAMRQADRAGRGGSGVERERDVRVARMKRRPGLRTARKPPGQPRLATNTSVAQAHLTPCGIIYWVVMVIAARAGGGRRAYGRRRSEPKGGPLPRREFELEFKSTRDRVFLRSLFRFEELRRTRTRSIYYIRTRSRT